MIFQSPVKKKIKARLIGMKNGYYISAQALLFKKETNGAVKKKTKNPNSSCEMLPLPNTHLHTYVCIQLYHTALHGIAQYLCTIICATIYIQEAHKPILTQKSAIT